jgi:DNA polymerase-3 subunit beta
MKIFCRKSDLNRALSNVSHSVPTRTTTRILEGILTEITNDEMVLTSTDTNITIETRIPIRSDETGSFVIPARLFIGMVSKLPDEEIMLEFDEAKTVLKVTSGNFNAEIICFKAEEFPKIKIEEKEEKIFITKETIKKLIKKTSFSASIDELNGVLTGVLVEIGEDNIKMVAVDTFRLAIYKAETKTDKEVSVIIPAKLINQIAKIISDENAEDMMSIEIIDNKVVLKFDNNKVIVNTLSGNFIDYNRIIRKESEIEVRINREELVRAIDRASILTSTQNNNLIKLEISDKELSINSLSDEGNITDKVSIIKDGEDITIGFNSRYLNDALKAIDDEDIMIYLKDNVSPCIIKSVDGEDYLYLILPVRIN